MASKKYKLKLLMEEGFKHQELFTIEFLAGNDLEAIDKAKDICNILHPKIKRLFGTKGIFGLSDRVIPF